MPLYRGGQRIAKLYRGATPIARAYKGAEKVFDGAAAAPVDITSVGSLSTDAVDRTTYTFSQSFGAAASDRKLIVPINGARSGGSNVSSVTIGGVSATRVTDGSDAAAVINGNLTSELWIADVPEGTSGDVVITWASEQARCGIGPLFRMTGAASSTAFKVATAVNSDALAASLEIPENGGGIGGAHNGNSAAVRTFTWTNLTEQYDGAMGEANGSFSGALSLTPGTATRTATLSGANSQSILLLASWAGA